MGCFENVLGIVLIACQWLSFNLIVILYLVFYPKDKKYTVVTAISHEQANAAHFLPGVRRPSRRKSVSHRLKVTFWPSLDDGEDEEPTSNFDERSVLLPSMNRTSELKYSAEYKQSLLIGLVVLLHLAFSTFITFLLLLSLPKYNDLPTDQPKENNSTRLVEHWATFLGVCAAVLAVLQYFPQLWHTYRTKVVGSLSIPMFCIQTPGAAFFVWSFIDRPGVNWTTWLVYAMTGLLQGCLLILCLAWKWRQRSLNIDDYGRPRSDK